MKRMTRALLAATLVAFAGITAAAPDGAPPSREERMAAMQKLPWQDGPAVAQVGSRSKLSVPADNAYLAETAGSRFLELSGNLPSPGTSILAGKRWWAALDFDEMGYVKDDEKIDADALMKSFIEWVTVRPPSCVGRATGSAAR